MAIFLCLYIQKQGKTQAFEPVFWFVSHDLE